MPRQTKPGLASIVRAYSNAVSNLLAELSEATAQDEKSGDVTLRLVQKFSRFVLDAGQAMKTKPRSR
jgi:hypothetical protein